MRIVWELRPTGARQPPTGFQLPASSSQLGEKPLISMRIVWQMYENCMRITSNWCSPTTNRLPASSFQLPVGRETVSVYVFSKETQNIRFSAFLKSFMIIWTVFLLFCHIFLEYYEKCMKKLFLVWETAVQLILQYFLYEKHKDDFFLYEKPLAGEFPPQTLARHNILIRHDTTQPTRHDTTDTTRHDTTRHDTTQPTDTTRHDRHDTTRPTDTTRHGQSRLLCAIWPHRWRVLYQISVFRRIRNTCRVT